MEFKLEPDRRNISNEVLLNDLIKLSKHFGKESVTQSEYEVHGQYSCKPFYRRFGSWNKALIAAGLKKNRTLGITNEELFANLETIWRTLGRQPHYSEVQKPKSLYSVDAYAKRFGSWRKALEAFVEYVNQEITAPSASDLKPNNEFASNLQSNKQAKTPTKSRHISWRLRFLIMRRDSFKCCNCGRSPAIEAGVILHVDHKKAWSKDGSSDYENLQTLCSVCNIGKSDLDESE
jgi:HNH endonuclease